MRGHGRSIETKTEKKKKQKPTNLKNQHKTLTVDDVIFKILFLPLFFVCLFQSGLLNVEAKVVA